MGYLFTDDAFENFHLRVEARIDDKSNSGVMFGLPEFRPMMFAIEKGAEAQISLSDPNGKTGSLFGRLRPRNTGDVPHKPNEWFTMEVIVKNKTITAKVNGKTTGEAPVDHNAGYPPGPGHIALQVHHVGSNKVEFRKVEVMPLGE